MVLFGSLKLIREQIDEFYDTLAEGGVVFLDGVRAYLDADEEKFQQKLDLIDLLESRADTLSKEVETRLYRKSLIPEYRGDVLGLLEHSDDVIDTAKASLYQFSVEKPTVPPELNQGFRDLAHACQLAGDFAVQAARTFFTDVDAVQPYLQKIRDQERQSDQLGEALKRQAFAMDLELAHKIQLRYFAHEVDKISDCAKAVGDRLAIYAIKRKI